MKGGRRVTERTLYRWLKRYENEGENLFKIKRQYDKYSHINEKTIKEFSRLKEKDEYLSIPEAINILERKELIKKGTLSRSTAWRIAKDHNLPLHLKDQVTKSKKMRFEYAHRLDMVICDGKHFRAGSKEHKRVLISFMDDSTRMCLMTKVGESENSRVFLRGLYDLIRHHGVPRLLFMDNGSGFKNHEVDEICSKLNINIVYGTARYPEGRGKIERFNRTITTKLLRGFRKNPEIDSHICFLESIIRKWIHEYNNSVHSSLGISPYEKWSNDKTEINFPYDSEKLREMFSVTLFRKVSPDNIIQHLSHSYELPMGYSGRKVKLIENVITNEILFDNKGELVLLKKVDLVYNAEVKRKGKGKPKKEKPTSDVVTVLTELLKKFPFQLVDENGNFFGNKEKGETL
jgi:transposase InsO family protein